MNIITDLGFSNGFAHFGGWFGDSIASQVNPHQILLKSEVSEKSSACRGLLWMSNPNDQAESIRAW